MDAHPGARPMNRDTAEALEPVILEAKRILREYPDRPPHQTQFMLVSTADVERLAALATQPQDSQPAAPSEGELQEALEALSLPSLDALIDKLSIGQGWAPIAREKRAIGAIIAALRSSAPPPDAADSPAQGGG